MPFTIRARQTQTFKIPGGSASAPSLTFANASTSGLFHSGGQGNVGVSVNGVERLTIHANGISVNGTVTANSLIINNASTVEYAPFSMANVQITDSTWTVLDDTAVSTDGGFIVINGNGFWGGTVVTVDSTPAIASSVLSYTKIGAQVPAKTAGTYAVSVIRPDALSVTLPTGLTYSPFPVWSTGSTLANVYKTVAFTQTLAATEASSSNITYTVANGSSLPANVTLSSGGVLSGNILTDPVNTTTYSFSITATDAQFQNNIPRTFGLTALMIPLPVSTGLVGWYDGASWTGAQWTDKSGSGNHATVVRGTIGTSTTPSGGIALTGSSAAGIQFPAAILPATYTLFHVAKYTGGVRQRIFDGVTQNWMSGFINPGAPLSGVAYHNGWLTQNTTSIHGDNWVVSADQNNLYRSNGVQRGNSGAGTPSYDRLSINYGFSGSPQYSDWAVSEVIVYNRTLTVGEITSIEAYLNVKSGL